MLIVAEKNKEDAFSEKITVTEGSIYGRYLIFATS